MVRPSTSRGSQSSEGSSRDAEQQDLVSLLVEPDALKLLRDNNLKLVPSDQEDPRVPCNTCQDFQFVRDERDVLNTRLVARETEVMVLRRELDEAKQKIEELEAQLASQADTMNERRNECQRELEEERRRREELERILGEKDGRLRVLEKQLTEKDTRFHKRERDLLENIKNERNGIIAAKAEKERISAERFKFSGFAKQVSVISGDQDGGDLGKRQLNRIVEEIKKLKDYNLNGLGSLSMHTTPPPPSSILSTASVPPTPPSTPVSRMEMPTTTSSSAAGVGVRPAARRLIDADASPSQLSSNLAKPSFNGPTAHPHPPPQENVTMITSTPVSAPQDVATIPSASSSTFPVVTSYFRINNGSNGQSLFLTKNPAPPPSTSTVSTASVPHTPPSTPVSQMEVPSTSAAGVGVRPAARRLINADASRSPLSPNLSETTINGTTAHPPPQENVGMVISTISSPDSAPLDVATIPSLQSPLSSSSPESTRNQGIQRYNTRPSNGKRHASQVSFSSGSEGKFKCYYCPKTYVLFGRLRNHYEKVHFMKDALKEFECGCMKCGSFFRLREDYIQHMNVIHGQDRKRRRTSSYNEDTVPPKSKSPEKSSAELSPSIPDAIPLPPPPIRIPDNNEPQPGPSGVTPKVEPMEVIDLSSDDDEEAEMSYNLMF